MKGSTISCICVFYEIGVPITSWGVNPDPPCSHHDTPVHVVYCSWRQFCTGTTSSTHWQALYLRFKAGIGAPKGILQVACQCQWVQPFKLQSRQRPLATGTPLRLLSLALAGSGWCGNKVPERHARSLAMTRTPVGLRLAGPAHDSLTNPASVPSGLLPQTFAGFSKGGNRVT